MNVDIFGAGIDALGKALGLPAPLVQAAKIGVGVYTGNVLLVVDGTKGLLGEIAAHAAATEYKPTTGLEAKGYAAEDEKPAVQARASSANSRVSRRADGTGARTTDEMKSGPTRAPKASADAAEEPAATAAGDSQAELKRKIKALKTVLEHFDSIESAGAFLGQRDSLMSYHDLQTVLSDTSTSKAVRDAVRHLLKDPAFLSRVDRGAGIGRVDGIITRLDLHSVLIELEAAVKPPKKPADPAPPVSDPVPPPGTGVPAPTEPPPPVDTRPPGSHVDPNMRQYEDALRTLDANYNTFDSATGALDGAFTRENLRAILDNPAASRELKIAAQFLVDHPEYFNRLEMATTKHDGSVSRADVKKELARVSDDLGTAPPPSSKPSPIDGGDFESPIRGILGDPAMSIEDKIEQILMAVLQRSDGELEEVAKQLAAAEDKRNSLNGDTTDTGKKAHADAARSAEMLSHRLQKLMQRRNEMFSLMTNVSKQFHEMAQRAIQNMRG